MLHWLRYCVAGCAIGALAVLPAAHASGRRAVSNQAAWAMPGHDAQRTFQGAGVGPQRMTKPTLVLAGLISAPPIIGRDGALYGFLDLGTPRAPGRREPRRARPLDRRRRPPRVVERRESGPVPRARARWRRHVRRWRVPGVGVCRHRPRPTRGGRRVPDDGGTRWAGALACSHARPHQGGANPVGRGRRHGGARHAGTFLRVREPRRRRAAQPDALRS